VQFWIIQTLNGVAYGMLLFLLSAGLSLILGMMQIANLAHGAFHLLASYIGYSVVRSTDNFPLTLAMSPDILIGYLGYTSFGHAAFFGVGAPMRP
jgi:branched-chain amino acid transport system permease protein